MRRLAYFITGMGLGALLGGVLALLYAPEAGETMREQIRAQLQALWEEARRAGEAERRRLEEELILLRRGDDTA